MIEKVERKELLKKAKNELIAYYNTCPLCKWPTNQCRMINWNRECIACTNDEWYWYSYKPKTITQQMIEEYVKINLELKK